MAKNDEKRAKSRKARMEARAAAEREAQLAAQRERKIQTAIGASVLAVVILILAVVGYFVGRNIYESTRSPEEVSNAAYAKVEAVSTKPQSASKDGGFLLSKNGVNKPVEGVPTIDDYMDFICPACGIVGRSIDADLVSMLDAGQINLNIHLAAFLNRSSTDNYSTRSAAFVTYVADNEPDKVMALIRAMFAEDFQPQEGSAYKSVSNDDLVKLAKSVGVSDSVAEAAAKGRYEAWVDATSAWYPTDSRLWNVSGSLKGQMTTPTILVNKNYWDYNTLMAAAGGSSSYDTILLSSLGLAKTDVGNASVLPSIGEGKPVGA